MAEPRDTEIRFNATRTLASRVDALVQSKNPQGRGELLIPLIEEMVAREVHAAIILLRIAGINPSDPLPPNGGGAE